LDLMAGWRKEGRCYRKPLIESKTQNALSAL